MKTRQLKVSVACLAVVVAAACGGPATEPTATVSPATTLAVAQPAATAAAPATTTAAPATTTTTAPATTTTSAAPLNDLQEAFDAGLAVKDSFFAAFNADDADAVMEVFAPLAVFSNEFGASNRERFEELLVWNIAQGTTYTPSDCAASAGLNGGTVRISCLFVTHDALMLAVDAPGVPFTMYMEMTAAGVVEYSDRFGEPNFNVVGIPFQKWMETHHPDDAAKAGFGNWTSVQEAHEHGLIRAPYAAKWATYLQDNDCTYDNNC